MRSARIYSVVFIMFSIMLSVLCRVSNGDEILIGELEDLAIINPEPFPANSRLLNVEIGDMNDDGRVDIVIDHSGGPLFWLRNEQAGSSITFVLDKLPIVPSDNGTSFVMHGEVYDWDGDEVVDIVDGEAWFRNNGTAMFTEQTGSKEGPFGDLDNDGDTDTVTTWIFQTGMRTWTVYLGWFRNNNGNLERLTIDSRSYMPSLSSITFDDPQIIDIDVDGDLDIIVELVNSDAFGANTELLMYLNDGGEIPEFDEFDTGIVYSNIYFEADAKMNGDDFPDIVLDSETGVHAAFNSGDRPPAFGQISPADSEDLEFLAAADVDGNDLDDIIVYDAGSREILIYFNFWETRMDFELSDQPVDDDPAGRPSLIPADLDDDDDMDLVFHGANFVGWYENENDGQSFNKHSLLSLSFFVSQSSDFDIVDMNLDGYADILTISKNSEGALAILLNLDEEDNGFEGRLLAEFASSISDVLGAELDGDPRLEAVVNGDDGMVWLDIDLDDFAVFSGESVTTETIALQDWVATDLDRDERDEIISLVFDQSFVNSICALYCRNGESSLEFDKVSLALDQFLASGSQLFHGDLDGDMDEDLLIAPNDFNLFWLENVDDGNLASFVRHDFPVEDNRIETAHLVDLDIDGDMDVLSVTHGDSLIVWYENDGEVEPSFTRLEVGSLRDVQFLSSWDMDLDGDKDVVAADFYGDISWFENLENKSFIWIRPLVGWQETDPSNLLDFNLDGLADFLTAPPFQIRLGREAETPDRFHARRLLDDPGDLQMAAAGDMDGDGDVDLVAVGRESNKVAWYEYKAFPFLYLTHIIYEDVQNVVAVDVSDLNSDGRLDIVTASSGDNSIAWYRNDGASPPNFNINLVTEKFDGAFGVKIADVDGDGDRDILGAAYDGGQLAWFENDGTLNPRFNTQHSIKNNFAGAISLGTLDLDGDGDLEVVSTANIAGKISWFENAHPQWTEHLIDGNLAGAQPLFIIDLDRDGLQDILAGPGSDNAVLWYRQVRQPAPGFVLADTITTGVSGLKTIYAADVDADSDVDVFTASWPENIVLWHENTGAQEFVSHRISVMYGGLFVTGADLDRDDDLDLVFCSGVQEILGIYENAPLSGEISKRILGTTNENSPQYPLNSIQLDSNGDGTINIADIIHSLLE